MFKTFYNMNKKSKIDEKLAEYEKIKQELDILSAKEKYLWKELEALLQKNKIKNIESNYLKIIYVEPTYTETIDKKRLEQLFPDVYSKVIKSKQKKGYYKKLTIKK